MDVEVRVDKELTEPKIIIYTPEITASVTDLAARLATTAANAGTRWIASYIGSEVVLLRPEDIFNIYAEGQKVLVRTANGTGQLKARLYEMEEKLAGTAFVRVSNSEIVNFNKVKSLDFSMAGTISLRFSDGGHTFVSRRYVEKIKTHLGL